MNQSVILTVVGSDRPGLTRALADAVYAVGGNWLESHLARLGGKYVGSVLVELPGDRLAELEAAAHAIDAEGLTVALVPAAAPVGDRGGQSLGIEIVGQDRPGIVREVTTVLAGLDVNIEDFTSEIEGSAWSGARCSAAGPGCSSPPPSRPTRSARRWRRYRARSWSISAGRPKRSRADSSNPLHHHPGEAG
ncbi:glycine cleavage system protein R [Rhizorhabdus histidinilytica]